MTHAHASTPGHRRAGMSIQSILLIMLLLVSVTSNVVVGLIGYVNGTDSLRDAASDRVTEVRDSRAREIAGLFATIENSMLVHSRGESVMGAAEDFSAAFAQLGSVELTESERRQLQAFYRDRLGPQLSAAVGEPVDVDAYLPTAPAESYLQLHYTVPPSDFTEAIAVTDAGDGSAWSAVHAEYHDYFARMTTRLDYQDTLLIDTEGNVVYSAFKGIDLGTNLLDGPYRASNLAEAYSTAMSERLLDSAVFTDFETYRPSLELPAAWGVSLISRDGVVTGALAVEMPIDRISDVMTGGGSWSASGLGTTGESYLVGTDDLMRSPSRELIEDPSHYSELAARMGVEPASIDRAVRTGDTLLLQPASTEAVERAQRGETGTVVATGYLGTETIAAYAPLRVQNLGWVIIAEVDTAEAFAPISAFTTNLIISQAILVLAISLVSLVIAQFLVRPLRRLRTAAERIAAGETDIQVDAGRTDELAAVATAFNEMSRSLQVKAELLEQQERENDRLLLSLMPETMAKRYREGVQNIAQDHQEACVMFADIVGFEAYSRTVDSEHGLEVLNELVKSFDEAAERIGVERVRTTRQGYLASCGLSVPRIDAARRMVEFATELDTILDRFNGQHGTELQLRAGIDLGTVTSGLIGRNSVVFDLWGDAVNLAFRIQGERVQPGIYASERVRERLADSSSFVDAGAIQLSEGAQQVWRIESARVDD